VLLYVWPVFYLRSDELSEIVNKLAPAADGLGVEAVVLRVRLPRPGGGLRDKVIEISSPAGHGAVVSLHEPTDEPIRPLSEYEQRVVRLAQRGLVYPYEIVRTLTPPVGATSELPPGDFREYDLDGDVLAPVVRPFGGNQANVVVGVVRSFTAKHPEGMARVLVLGDPSRELGSLAEPECRRLIAALDLADQEHLPVDWIALSAGAKISMESGTENMDWIARVLRRLVRFTQAGGEVNVVVNGINVGAQPYWNAEATMLMHTRGILVMMPDSAMVLTGKRALDYSGGVSAEDNQGIGGYERIMGPNGQAQYFARDLLDACRLLLRHHEHAYVAPGERRPRRGNTVDPADRDVCSYPYGKADGHGFALVGEVFSEERNPGRKKPFDIRSVMTALIDQDHPPLERWFSWQEAEMAVVWDAHLGGFPVCLLGIESRPLQRLGFVPADGPDQWTGGTLFPQSSRKVARALNAASGNRPVIVLANLTGFDGSPESLRLWQLEYGAEIGRAVVNFEGPLVFCVISRYHGGAFVVFSNALNDNLRVIALEGTHASVIGGAPAAAVGGLLAGGRQARGRGSPDPSPGAGDRAGRWAREGPLAHAPQGAGAGGAFGEAG
jgi:acetyl-CoA carboxylase carboxyltransferase component